MASEFNGALAYVSKGPKLDVGNDTKLKMYALFKQQKQGPCNVPRPGTFDFVGRAKWTAWHKLGDMSKDEARAEYVRLVSALAPKWRAWYAARGGGGGAGGSGKQTGASVFHDGFLPIKRTLYDDDKFDAYRARVAKFIMDDVRAHHDRWEKDGIVDRAVYRKAAEAGIMNFQVPKRFGGRGITDFRYNTIVMEETCKEGVNAPLIGLSTDIVLPYLLHYTTEEQKRRWLPRVAKGECILAIAMSEPHTGSDVAGIRTRAVKQRDGSYVLNGEKMWISNAKLNDLILVVCVTDASRGHAGISILAVERGMPGYETVELVDKIGYRGRDVGLLRFTDVRVPANNLIGKEGHGFRYLMLNLPQERIAIAIEAVGTAETALQHTIHYLKHRKAFGRPLGAFQHLSFQLAEMKTDVQIARVFIDKCIALHCDGKLDIETAAMAKWWCTALQKKVLDSCVQMHGGYGILKSYPTKSKNFPSFAYRAAPIGKMFADARVNSIYGGANEVMKEIIARKLGFARM